MKLQFRISHILIVTLLVAVGVLHLQHRHIQSQLDRKIEQLDLSLRATNCLIYGEVETVRDLIERDEEQLLSIRNMGETTVQEIRTKVESLGFELRQVEQDDQNQGLDQTKALGQTPITGNEHDGIGLDNTMGKPST